MRATAPIRSAGSRWKAHGKIEGCDLGVATCSGQISVRFADTTLLAAPPAPARRCSFDGLDARHRPAAHHRPAGRLPSPWPERAISGPNGIEARTSFQAAKPSSGAFVTITLKNDVESYA